MRVGTAASIERVRMVLPGSMLLESHEEAGSATAYSFLPYVHETRGHVARFAPALGACTLPLH